MNIGKFKRWNYKLKYSDTPYLKNYDIYGCHLKIKNGIPGAEFCLWAPNALEVSVVGSFNDWQDSKHKMHRKSFLNLWTIFIPGVNEWDTYKYKIRTKGNKYLLKSDPYAFYSDLRPDNASKVVNLGGFTWHDETWMSKRNHSGIYDKPLNIYELHLSSWRRTEDNNFKDYKTLADEIVQYVKEMGYTHIELLPLTEHPLDASWGYQVTGYFSLTSRFGSPHDFMYFVDKMHENNIGVLLDWVPGHFCKDAHGLYNFDGTHLYEPSNPLLAENYGWGTSNFDFSKHEVIRFLISNALFWFDTYHIDGMRIDAVANMLYLNYGREDNPKLRNKYGGNENLEAIDFLKKLNKYVFKNFPNVLMAAEDSSSFPGVTKPTYIGGLGFNYKWNMGWMNDMLKYMEMDPIYRKWHHNLITFSLMYAFSENFILPLSHDEVVHGKKSLLDKMPGDYGSKFASLRLFYGYMCAHPGKKLLFMGGELGQFIEWRFDHELDWNLLAYPMHMNMKEYVKTLNNFYKDEKSLWELDHTYDGFSWIDHQNCDQSIISFIRKSKTKDDFLIIICNFTPVTYDNYKIGAPRLVDYREVFNSDLEAFGGSNVINDGIISPSLEKWHNQPYHITIKIPPLSVIFIKPEFNNKNIKFIPSTTKGGQSNAKKRNVSNDSGRRTRK